MRPLLPYLFFAVIGAFVLIALLAHMAHAHTAEVSAMETRFLYCFHWTHDAKQCYDKFIGL